MSVDLRGSVVHLHGACPAADAERLVMLLQARPGVTVDVSEVEQVHSAVAQVLMAFRPTLAGLPADEFLARWIVPLLGNDCS